MNNTKKIISDLCCDIAFCGLNVQDKVPGNYEAELENKLSQLELNIGSLSIDNKIYVSQFCDRLSQNCKSLSPRLNRINNAILF